jgi:hypothetical protein
MINVELPYVPIYYQDEIFQDRTAIRCFRGGRGAGKDVLGTGETFLDIATWADEQRPEWLVPKIEVLYLGPTFSSVKNNWTWLKYFLEPIKKGFEQAGKKVVVREDEKLIVLPLHDGEAHIELMSLDNPGSILGRGVDLAIVTECDSIPNNIIDHYLFPMLNRPGRKGLSLFLGTTRCSDDSWWIKLCKDGERGVPGVKTWHYTSLDNPHADKDKIMLQASVVSDYVFQTEYMAEYVGDSEAAFRNVDGCVGGALEEPVKDRAYVIGLDIGQKIDFTVAVVMDKERRKVVDIDRFSKIDWGIQKNRVIQLVEKYNNALVAIDSANVGSMFSADLKQSKLRVKEVNFHSTIEKERIINGLKLALEKETVKIPQDPKTMPLISELRLYKRISTNKQGQEMRYATHRAPIGLHDDCVISLGLALDACPRVGGWDKPIILKAPIGAFPK